MSAALRAVKKEFVGEFRISWRDERMSATTTPRPHFAPLESASFEGVLTL